MKRILLLLFISISVTGFSQPFNNEWIDYSKTYYKFKIYAAGHYRVSMAALNSINLGNTPAEHFQIWKNGEQVRLHTSTPSGPLGPSGYIQFWADINDGKADKDLYLNPDFQLNDKWSLQTDTAAYFLTVNTVVEQNLRFTVQTNDVASNVLTIEPYFLHKIGNYFRNRLNPGNAAVVGEYVYSSAYDKGEGWTSQEIQPATPLTATHNNLFTYAGGPDPKIKINLSGNAINTRAFRVDVNNDSIGGQVMDFFNYVKDDITFPLAKITSNTAVVRVTNRSAAPLDRMVVHQYELIYPRLFNFGGERFFEFELPANSNGNYLEISNFNYGVAPPVLYDYSNGDIYFGNTTTPGVVKIALKPSSVDRKLRLATMDATFLFFVNPGMFQTRNFINYSLPANQGDYLIISHQRLFNGVNGTNPVEDYRAYRASANGGGYNAKLYLIDELVDQFGLGIKKHPNSIRNFLRFARATYPVLPKGVFLIGKGVQYVQYRIYESYSDMDGLALVPTFGQPASDILLSANPGSAIPLTPIGRLSAITPAEVQIYLNKIKEFETAQRNPSPLIDERAWMKNVVHVVGASDPTLGTLLENYMNKYKQIISDTNYGANVTTFSKSSSDAVQQLASEQLEDLFERGISLITYFGHSSSSTLEFNLDDPNNYNNAGKYPMFIALGCNAGNFYNYNSLRYIIKETLSEKFVLAENRGSIGFVASTHFGIVHYLDIYNTRNYNAISKTHYGRTMGEIMKEAVTQVFNLTSQNDFYARFHCEQTTLHGDPMIKLNPHPKPDYVIEDPMVKVTPTFISVAETEFKVNATFLNMGKAIPNNIVVEVKRQYPNLVVETIYRDTIPGIRYSDSISINVPIDPNRDKGTNKITVTIDADNNVDEIFENNNSITKDVIIYEDEARPVYPYTFAIVNKQNFKVIASTANPFSSLKNYTMEMDTTELFNSPLKVTRTISAKGGLLEFDPGITYRDSTVYYWRVSPVPVTGAPVWNNSSFIYLPNSDVGFNQSHYFQHKRTALNNMSYDSASRSWKFGNIVQNLFIKQGTWVTSGAVQESALSVSVNGVPSIRLTCWFQSLVFNVFDPVTFKAMENDVVRPASGAPDDFGEGLFGSLANQCRDDEERYYNFEFRYVDTSSRRKMREFMDNAVPNGSYVVVRNFTLDPNTFPAFPQSFINDWIADQAIYGPGQTLYHYLKNVGFAGIDSFYRARSWAVVYKKGDAGFEPKWMVSQGVYDNPSMTVECFTPDTLGKMVSPMFGPAKAWKELRWRGNSIDAQAGDHPTMDVIGVRADGTIDTLFYDISTSQQNFDLSSVPAVLYPHLKLHMRNSDSINFTPYQLRYWRLTYVPVPEGAVAPNIYFTMKDTVEVGEPIDFKLAFKNISDAAFDSLRVKMTITDRNNVSTVVPIKRHRPLGPNDTLHVSHYFNTRTMPGWNSVYVDVNPDNDQPEQYHFNNFIFRNVYVKPDSLNPLLDVTFDGVHILNRDIVASKPHVVVKLKDEARWMILDDTSRLTLQVRYPDGTLRSFNFDNDTLRFTPAGQAPNAENTATLDFMPYFPEDGEYELIVSGKDMSENQAGAMEYRVSFQVINKPMISNMLNYPNPFTTSTAFVFTITGSEVPQNIRIQIMTVTGKIVREITKDELGPLHVGRNITEYKWDGTDQFGQKLANGVYLYRVITNLNGKALDKYKSQDDKTDKYFNKGYGKMVLMR